MQQHLNYRVIAEAPRLRRTAQKPGREELPLAQGHGQWRRVPGCIGTGAAERSYATSEVKSGGRDELPHAWGQGQWMRGDTTGWRSGWRPRGGTPRPGSSSCMGAGGPRGPTPRSRSGGATVRRYPSSKVRSSGCALLEQPWRDTPRPR